MYFLHADEDKRMQIMTINKIWKILGDSFHAIKMYFGLLSN